MTTMTPLDNPAFHALVGPHAGVAERVGNAVRYPVDIVPFGGLPDAPNPADWEALRELVGPGHGACLFRGGVDVPDGWQIVHRVACHQMVAPDRWPDEGGLAAWSVEPIRDAAALDELVRAARPGPWFARTAELGGFAGIYADDQLVCAAGYRLAPTGAREISAVSTHEEFRGLGLARAVVRHVAARIECAAEQPFLHVVTDNHSAIASYLRTGFTVRRQLEVVILTAPP